MSITLPPLRAAIVVALMALGLCASEAAARPPVIPIVLSGDPAPNASTFTFAREAALTPDGRLLAVMNIDTGSEIGIYTENEQGDFELVVRTGDTTPGMPAGTTLFAAPLARFSRSGEVAFEAFVRSPGDVFDSGIWGPGPGGVPTLLAREGDPAPGVQAGLTFASLGDFTISELGQVVFTARLEGPGVDQDNESGVWATNLAGVLELQIRGGDTHPNLPANVFFKSFIQPRFDSEGVLEFLSTLRGAGINSSNDSSKWGNDGFGELGLLMREGDQVPILPGGTGYASLGLPLTNSSGFSAFRVTLAGFSVDTSNLFAILGLDRSGTLELLARKGSQAPGAESGVTLGGAFCCAFNEAGDVAFTGFVEGPGFDLSNRDAAFGPGVSGELTKLMQRGEPVSGLPPGVTYGQPSGPGLTPLGGIVTEHLLLSGPGVDASNNRALFYADAFTAPAVVIRTGDAVEIEPGDTRVVESFSANLIPNQTVGMAPFDDDGELLVRLIFTDDSNGFFLIPVPEASASLGALAALGTLASLARRSRRAPSRGSPV